MCFCAYALSSTARDQSAHRTAAGETIGPV
jgi:hypothetical protein